MADFTLSRGTDENPLVLAASAAAGEVWQLPDGRAAYMAGLTAGVAGDARTFTTTGTGVLTKTAGFVALKGRRAYWDHSANAVYFKKNNDRDYYIGRFAADAASADTTCAVTLNIDPPAAVDLLRDGVISVPTGTQAVGGFGFPKVIGGGHTLELTATNEAQCIDMLSRDRFALGSNWIADFVIVPEANGSTSAVDFNIGVANAPRRPTPTSSPRVRSSTSTAARRTSTPSPTTVRRRSRPRTRPRTFPRERPSPTAPKSGSTAAIPPASSSTSMATAF